MKTLREEAFRLQAEMIAADEAYSAELNRLFPPAQAVIERYRFDHSTPELTRLSEAYQAASEAWRIAFRAACAAQREQAQ